MFCSCCVSKGTVQEGGSGEFASIRASSGDGCANPNFTPNPLLDTSAHGEKREAWCKIVPGSCMASVGAKATVPAGNDWDSCSKTAHVHLTIPMRL